MEYRVYSHILFMETNTVYGLKEILGDPEDQGSLYDRFECQGLTVVIVDSPIRMAISGGYHWVQLGTNRIIVGNTKIHAEVLFEGAESES